MPMTTLYGAAGAGGQAGAGSRMSLRAVNSHEEFSKMGELCLRECFVAWCNNKGWQCHMCTIVTLAAPIPSLHHCWCVHLFIIFFLWLVTNAVLSVVLSV